MSALLAHLKLMGRHGRWVTAGDLHWRYCAHRSHRLGLRCWRWFWYDGYCGKHNGDCWGDCPGESTQEDGP